MIIAPFCCGQYIDVNQSWNGVTYYVQPNNKIILLVQKWNKSKLFVCVSYIGRTHKKTLQFARSSSKGKRKEKITYVNWVLIWVEMDNRHFECTLAPQGSGKRIMSTGISDWVGVMIMVIQFWSEIKTPQVIFTSNKYIYMYSLARITDR